MQGKTMTEGTPWIHILKFSIPVLAGSLLQQLYNTADAIVVGNFAGEDALAAVGTTSSFVFLFMALAIGLSSGLGVVVAQFFGAPDVARVRSNAASGHAFLMTLGIAATIVGIAVSRPAFTFLVGVPENFLEQTLLYFRIYWSGLSVRLQQHRVDPSRGRRQRGDALFPADLFASQYRARRAFCRGS